MDTYIYLVVLMALVSITVNYWGFLQVYLGLHPWLLGVRHAAPAPAAAA